MTLVISQRFPLCRFHATRWNQNPFEDPYGEWPPSPWRLLRALAARWFQYSRETGDEDEAHRDDLFKTLASAVPAFRLPELTWRGQALRQYQPTGLEDQYKYKNDPATKKKVLDYSYKQVGKTLVQDHYRALPPQGDILWIWDSLLLSEQHLQLLRELLRRTLYFGRAESLCLFDVLEPAIDTPVPNCRLSPNPETGTPVLVPSSTFDIRTLLAATDDALLARRRIPTGTSWHYADVPPRPAALNRSSEAMLYAPKELQIIQFAVGGRVFPPSSKWVKITERFRGQVLRIRAQQLTGNQKATYRSLSQSQRAMVALLSGKDGHGKPLRKHEHAYFSLRPDENGLPTRLVCWRTSPFTSDEIAALLAASNRQYSWENGLPDWTLKLVPLPFETPPPVKLFGESSIWKSATPFVPPGNRRRFRPNGKERPGESPQRLLAKLLGKCGYPGPTKIEFLDDFSQEEWMVVHTTREQRFTPGQDQTTNMLRGYRFVIHFPQTVRGPIALGHSSHYGLGLFAALDD